VIVTVTLNAAMDRTLLVPSFNLGHRHRASQAVASAGGKGLNVARALRGLGVPVVATGFVGGRTGTQIGDDLMNEGILNDFVRIEGESRTSTAVLDPIADQYTEINEWGPEVSADELGRFREKLEYLTQGAEFVVFAGSLPRGVDPAFYGELVRDLAKQQVLTVLDTEGEPLRLGVGAELRVETDQRACESLEVPVVGVLQPEAHAAALATRNRRVGLLATEATVASRRYEEAVHAHDAGVELTSVPCPRLVPLIEGPDPFGEETTEAVREVAAPLQAAGVDTVILGCTHYPILRPIFQRVFGRSVTLVFSADETAREVAETLARKGIENDESREGAYRFLTTGDPDAFREMGKRFLQLPIRDVEHVTLEAAAPQAA